MDLFRLDYWSWRVPYYVVSSCEAALPPAGLVAQRTARAMADMAVVASQLTFTALPGAKPILDGGSHPRENAAGRSK